MRRTRSFPGLVMEREEWVLWGKQALHAASVRQADQGGELGELLLQRGDGRLKLRHLLTQFGDG